MRPFPCIAAVLLSLVVSTEGEAQQTPNAPPQIVASGEGEARVTPDRVYADIAVETTAETAVAAATENARRVAAVRAALQRAGVQASAITNVGYAVAAKTRYEQGTERELGYQAVHTLRVESERLERIGTFIDAALAAGANGIREVRYTSRNQESARRAAIAAAVARARTDAEAMAQAAGGRLGNLLEVSTSRFGAPPGVFMQESMAMMRVREETTITPRELVLRATVLGRWAYVGN
jgi:uncharacterized protein YggE